ncbi:hypothetical protein LPJ79_005327, partial [Coemansia sp. RSA 1821]
MDDYAHAQHASTAMRVHMEATANEPSLDSFSSINDIHQQLLQAAHVLTTDDEQAFEQAREISDDSNPVSAYFEILTIRRLLLERVDVVLSLNQLNSPDVQLNLLTPLWQAVRERCGVWRAGDMRHSRGLQDILENAAKQTTEQLGGPLASAAILYASLANRDYFLALASTGQSQAELHESRAQVAESLSILCAKALHKMGSQVLINALCVKFTPIDMDGMHAAMMQAQMAEDPTGKPALGPGLKVRGDRHISLLSADQRVRVYRLGRAGDLAIESDPPSHSRFGSSVSRMPSGWSTPMHEIAHDYLSRGSRIVVEHAIEVAIRSEAKRFTAQKLVGEIVKMLWDGTLHWKGFRCVCLPKQLTASPTPLLFERRASSSSISSNVQDMSQLPSHTSRYFRVKETMLEKWLAQALAPLRIPMVENILLMIHAFFFLTLYTLVTLQRQAEVSIEEVILHVCAFAYIADEIRQCSENGLSVYLKSVWNVLDITIYSVFVAFFCLRLRSLYTGSEDDLDKAYDVLALNASMLWPRLFAVLDQFEFCGTIIIQVRRIIAGTSLFFALLIVMTAGFFQTFYSLSVRHNELEARNIWGLMTRIFFGSALLGWDQADLFGPYVGYLVMAMYIGVSMLILYNILIGVINQCMVEIHQNSAQEFRFAYTMRVVEYVSARQTYPCVPPLNLLQVAVFWPLRQSTLLTPRSFSLFRSILLLIAYSPHLLLYMCYKRIGRWWRDRSGMHSRALKSECHLAEKELAFIKLSKDDIDEFAFSTADALNDQDSGQQTASCRGQYGSTSRIDKSPTSLLRNPESSVTIGSADRSDATSKWVSLVSAWKSRHKPPQLPNSRWSPNEALQASPTANEQNRLKLAQLEAKMADIDKKLATITRLLQP